MRLDKFLAEMNIGSRSQVKELIRQGVVCVNQQKAVAPEQQLDPEQDEITCRGKKLFYEKYVYYMMYKPAGVVTATHDRREKTVLDLLRNSDCRTCSAQVNREETVLNLLQNGLTIITNPATAVSAEAAKVPLATRLSDTSAKLLNFAASSAKSLDFADAFAESYDATVKSPDTAGHIRHRDIFPVGRLDKDTEGLLLLTNDGELAHKLLPPRKHVEKTYYVQIEKPLTPPEITALTEGLNIGDEKNTLPAQVTLLSPHEIHLTITEGRFHQVKRMLQAVDNRVLYLKRLSMGGLVLDETLAKGCFRPLTAAELNTLRNAY